MSVVLDASAIAPYLLADEENHLVPGVSEALTTTGAIVPMHWHVEVANLLLVASRKGRLDEAARAQAERVVSSAILSVDELTGAQALQRSWTLAQAHRLTIYDACYLELAMRKGAPLATNDSALIDAARAESVPLLGR